MGTPLENFEKGLKDAYERLLAEHKRNMDKIAEDYQKAIQDINRKASNPSPAQRFDSPLWELVGLEEESPRSEISEDERAVESSMVKTSLVFDPLMRSRSCPNLGRFLEPEQKKFAKRSKIRI